MGYYINEKRSCWKRAKDLVRKTSIEILVLGTIGVFAGGGLGIYDEITRGQKIPLGFSEITQLEKDALKKSPDGKVGEITENYAKTNDMAMNVFEAWNLTNKKINLDFDKSFAQELEFKVDPTFRTHHYNLSSFFSSMEEIGNRALEKMKDLSRLEKGSQQTGSQFGEVWDYSSYDTTHQECTTVESCNSEGECSSHEECHTVCDHTTHVYNYHKQEGEEAMKILDEVLEKNRGFKFPEELQIVKSTNADGEYAAETSSDEKDKKNYNDKLALLKKANMWNFGSTYNSNQDEILTLWHGLPNEAEKWRRDKNTAQDETFITPCMMHESPKEFDSAEKIRKDSNTLYKRLEEITGGVKFMTGNVSNLKRLVNEYIQASLDGAKGSPRKLRRDLMKITKEIYKKNFKEGFDVDRFRWSIVLLYSFFGGLVGSGFGYGLDKLGNRYYS